MNLSGRTICLDHNHDGFPISVGHRRPIIEADPGSTFLIRTPVLVQDVTEIVPDHGDF